MSRHATPEERRDAIATQRTARARREATREAQDDRPGTLPAVVARPDAAVWAEWSQDREARAQQQQATAEVQTREAANVPIWPRECADRIAQDTRRYARDWRAIRPELGEPWRRLLKAQPELRPELTQQREAVLVAILNSVPPHLRATVNQLRTLIDLFLTGHEAAAYAVGFAAGQLDATFYTDQRGRTRQHRGQSRPLTLSLALDR